MGTSIWQTCMHIPVDVGDVGEEPGGDSGLECKFASALGDEPPAELFGSSDKFHISRKAIVRYGVTPGCPGCNGIAMRGQRPGKFMYNRCNEYVGIALWKLWKWTKHIGSC